MENCRCPNCGEEYSATYRSCPFCEEEEALRRGRTVRRRSGRRLDRSKRDGAGGVILLLTGVVILGVLAFVLWGDEIGGMLGIRVDPDEVSTQGDGEPSTGGDVQGGGAGQDTQAGQPPLEGAGDGTGAGAGEGGTGEGAGTGSGAGTGDGTDEGTGEGEAPPESAGPLTLSHEAITIGTGDRALLTVTGGGGGEVTWSTSNENIAAVENGSVTGVAGGTVTVTATAGEETATCTVTITGEPWVSPAELSLNRTDFTLYPDDPDVQMEVRGTDSPVVWRSNDPSVAAISETGVVTWVGPGTTTVTAAVDGQELSCWVRVKP